jgi:hypothetical protein
VTTIDLVLWIIALGCFVAAAFNVRSRVALLPAGLALGTLTLFACAPMPPTIVTPEGARAFQADELLRPVENLEDAAIAAYRSGSLPQADARAIVLLTREIAVVADAAEEGWRAAVLKAWQEAKRELPTLTTGRWSSYVTAIEAVLTGGVE